MQSVDKLIDPTTVRQRIGERLRELRMLRAIERAVVRYQIDTEEVGKLKQSGHQTPFAQKQGGAE